MSPSFTDAQLDCLRQEARRLGLTVYIESAALESGRPPVWLFTRDRFAMGLGSFATCADALAWLAVPEFGRAAGEPYPRRTTASQPRKETMKNIDTRLERDPRYAEAKARLDELQHQTAAAERERTELIAGLGALAAQRAADTIKAEARALIAGTIATEAKQREVLTASLEQVEHRLAVLREAVYMQRQTVGALANEVSQAICADLRPKHIAHVQAIIAAARTLAECCAAESALREELTSNGVTYSGYLRPMPVRGFDVTDANSTVSRFLLEAVQFGFLDASDLPPPLQELVPPPATQQPTPKPKRSGVLGWANA
jgi:hypothetical protein